MNVPFVSFLALGGDIIFGILANNIYMSRLNGMSQQAKTMSEPTDHNVYLKIVEQTR